MSKTEPTAAQWPQACPLNDNGCMPTGDEPGTTGLPFDELLAEHRRRWRLAPVAEALSLAVEEYCAAVHLGNPNKDEKMRGMLNMQQAFEKAAT